MRFLRHILIASIYLLMASSPQVDWIGIGLRVGPNGRSPSGTPFNYFCYGASTSEVELDCLTGDLTVLRTDLIMDVGDSLNPAIDVGQIEGAFMQGMGWRTLEEVKFSDEAHAWAGKPGDAVNNGARCL